MMNNHLRLVCYWVLCGGLTAGVAADDNRLFKLNSYTVVTSTYDTATIDAETNVAENAYVDSESHEKHIKALIDSCNFDMRIGDINGAIQNAQKVLQYDADNFDARLILGTAYANMNRYEEALSYMLPLLDQYSDNVVLLNNIAWIKATANDYSVRNSAEAISLAQQALLYAPRNASIWSTLSEAYFVGGEFEKAYAMAEEAITLYVIDGTVDQERLRQFHRQLQKCRQAKETMSILD